MVLRGSGDEARKPCAELRARPDFGVAELEALQNRCPTVFRNIHGCKVQRDAASGDMVIPQSQQCHLRESVCGMLHRLLRCELTQEFAVNHLLPLELSHGCWEQSAAAMEAEKVAAASMAYGQWYASLDDSNPVAGEP